MVIALPKRCLILLLLLWQAACTSPPEPVLPVRVEERPVVVASEAAVVAEDRQVAQWLAAGRAALAADRLMVPVDDSAYSWFKRVLQRDGTNQQAHWGMRQINDRYLEMAAAAFRRGDARQGEAMLERAGQIATSPQQLATLRQQYRALMPAALPPAGAEGGSYLLSVQDLTARNEQMVSLLAEVAQRARQVPSRLLIVARSDAEGRWIYQTMRDAVDGYRLRGNISRGDTPKVVLIDVGN